MRTRAVKLNNDGVIIDHRPRDHEDVNKDEWVNIEWDKEMLNGMSFNELIANRCATIQDEKLVIGKKNPVLPSYSALRKRAYSGESDYLKLIADNEAAYDGVEPDYTEWRAKVLEIKTRFPKVS